MPHKGLHHRTPQMYKTWDLQSPGSKDFFSGRSQEDQIHIWSQNKVRTSTVFSDIQQNIAQRTSIINSWVKSNSFCQMLVWIPHEIFFFLFVIILLNVKKVLPWLWNELTFPLAVWILSHFPATRNCFTFRSLS